MTVTDPQAALTTGALTLQTLGDGSTLPQQQGWGSQQSWVLHSETS